MTGQLTTRGAAGASLSFANITFTLSLHTAWGERVELLEGKEGAKTRQARVYARIYGTPVFSEVFLLVRVPASLDDHAAAHAAAHAAHHRLRGYSWTLWARERIAEKHAALRGDPAFTLALRMLSTEWMPRHSAQGREHIERVLGLGNFSSLAFPAGLTA